MVPEPQRKTVQSSRRNAAQGHPDYKLMTPHRHFYTCKNWLRSTLDAAGKREKSTARRATPTAATAPDFSAPKGRRPKTDFLLLTSTVTDYGYAYPVIARN